MQGVLTVVLRLKQEKFKSAVKICDLSCFSFVGEKTQTAGSLGQLLSPDDVTINQLQAISKLLSSDPPSETFFQLSKLTIRTDHGRL